jgi:putative two-component system response regulator
MFKKGIICVDDESFILDSLKSELKDIFNDSVYVIEMAESGEEALEIIEEFEEDGIELSLVISDYLMPQLKGDELLIEIHNKKPKTKKVLLTGQASLDGVAKAINEANLYRYISKPWDKHDLLLTLQEALKSYHHEKEIEKHVEELEKLNKEIEETQKEVVFQMGSIGETRSQETGFHVKRVAEYSKLLALLYGLSEEDAELLKMASPMHDIGKVGIPDSILKKPAKLTSEEFEVMKTHAELGWKMLGDSTRPILKAASIIAIEHHERWDGNGYPKGKSGDDIHIYGRITALADVFDALGSDRCYKKAWELEKILTLLTEEKGKQFDPKLIDLFFENLESFLQIRDSLKDTI